MVHETDPAAAMRAAEVAIAAADPAPPQVVTQGGVIRLDARLGDGRSMVGDFTFMLPLSVNAQTKIGLVSSRMRGGMPLAAFTEDKATLIEMVAFLQVSLQDVPTWARNEAGDMNLGELPIFLVERLYSEVAAHAERFRDACELRGPSSS